MACDLGTASAHGEGVGDDGEVLQERRREWGRVEAGDGYTRGGG